jgi:hypothetical protein
MKTSKRSRLIACVIAILVITVVLHGQSATVKPSGGSGAAAARWSVQVDQVDPGSLDLADSFQIAIYENLVDELKKTKQFQQVFRQGDHSVSEVPNLLVLKTTVEKYTPGSETRRAVTTVSGATKLTVRSQLLTREGRVVLERTIDGDVRFFGSNLRATHNLARNIAKTIKKTSWPSYPEPTALLSAQPATKASQQLEHDCGYIPTAAFRIHLGTAALGQWHVLQEDDPPVFCGGRLVVWRGVVDDVFFEFRDREAVTTPSSLVGRKRY